VSNTEEKGLETLKVWRKSLEFASAVYKEVIPLLPQEEKWILGNQIRRSSQSIPANIAEGYGRHYYQECIRFCYIARGSLEETYSQLCLAHNLCIVNDLLFKRLETGVVELRRMINGYISYLKNNRIGANEPGANLSVKDNGIDATYLIPEQKDNFVFGEDSSDSSHNT